MNSLASDRPWSDSAASWRAAIQPSVRASSVATSPSVERQPHGLEVARRLRRREAKVARPDLDEAAARSESCERERWIGACPDHDMGVRRQVLEDVCQLIVDRRRLDDVEVVQHEDDVRLDPRKRVQEGGQTGVDGARPTGEDRPRGASDAPIGPIQRLHDVGPERDWVVVGGLEGQPGDECSVRTAGELGQDRRLAESGRRGHQRQRCGGRAGDLLAQARPRHESAVRRRQVELRLEERSGHERAVPTVNPWTKVRWRMKNTTRGGRNAITRPANRRPSSVA